MCSRTLPAAAHPARLKFRVSASLSSTGPTLLGFNSCVWCRRASSGGLSPGAALRITTIGIYFLRSATDKMGEYYCYRSPRKLAPSTNAYSAPGQSGCESKPAPIRNFCARRSPSTESPDSLTGAVEHRLRVQLNSSESGMLERIGRTASSDRGDTNFWRIPRCSFIREKSSAGATGRDNGSAAVASVEPRTAPPRVPPPAIKAHQAPVQWSRPPRAFTRGVRPNSPTATTNVSSSWPVCSNY